MSSRFLEAAAALLMMTGLAQAGELRVCADPDNLPFSNAKGEGFENRIVDAVARELSAKVTYVWDSERRTTAIEILNKGRCDLVPGAIAGTPTVATTSPYMRSAYAFVLKGERQGLALGFEDPRLRHMRIGVQSVGDDALTPPVEALLRRGLGASIRPFTLHGNASDPNSAGAMVAAVASGAIDAVVLWGPFAGWFANQHRPPLTVELAKTRSADPQMSFAISMAMRKQDVALRDAVDRALAARRAEITEILAAYHVPLQPLAAAEVTP